MSSKAVFGYLYPKQFSVLCRARKQRKHVRVYMKNSVKVHITALLMLKQTFIIEYKIVDICVYPLKLVVILIVL